MPILFTKNLAFKENLKINNVNTYFIYISTGLLFLYG